MTLGSFTLDDTTIDITADYSHIDGRVYKLVEARSKRQVAVTTYRGLDVADSRFSKGDLEDGLRKVLRQAVR